ncbi:hypothetical protein K490DRAFT_6809, partial [Saccharata proteae CBS 121410]
KSRTGCQRCKLKRLKCDETKPGCKNCRTRGITCPGYRQLIKWSTKYEAYMPGASKQLIVGPNQMSTEQLSAKDSAMSPSGATSSSESPSLQDRPESDGGNAEQPRKRTRLARGHDSHSHVIRSPRIERRQNATSSHLPRVSECMEPLEVDEPAIQAPLSDDGAPEESVHDSEAQEDEVEDVGDDAEDASLQETHEEAADSTLLSSLMKRYKDMTTPRPGQRLVTPEMKLVEHYFKNVCVIYSSFDSSLNPFRSAVGRIWDSSPSIYYAIQSMAAAQLANWYPHLAPTGIEMQQKAYEALDQELRLVKAGCMSSERVLLAILLLGLTAAWHNSGDLGIRHLNAARALIYPRLVAPVPPDNKIIRRQNQFFEESLIYWEMLMGFVNEESQFDPRQPWNSPTLGQLGLSPSNPRTHRSGNIAVDKYLPHPWTGIAPKVQMIFAEIGRLVRHQRTAKIYGNPEASYHSTYWEQTLAWAAVLEEELLGSDMPLAEDLIDPGDEKTSKDDFIAVAEAYRCAGLLEIYRVFPDILKKRLGDSQGWEQTGIRSLTPSTPGTAREATDMRIWLNSLALHILSLLESLPSSSGTGATQPILLVAAAGELRFVSSLDYFDIYANNEKIRHARRFVRNRMQEFTMRLPSKPLHRMIELIEEVWRKLDAGQDVFWLDVMVQNGWQTVM